MAMQTKIVGNGSGSVDVPWAVDPTFKAAHIALSPLEYANSGRVLGHYAVAQRSGELVATIGALGHLGSIRWAVDDAYLVLLRLKVGWSISAAVTTAVEMNMRAIIARGFSVDFTTAATAINMATVPKTNAMRNSMGSSLMGTAGPRIATTTVQSGQTLTADSAPFAMCVWSSRYPTNSTGTAVAQAVGDAGLMQTLYEYTALAQHPVVLSLNEGVIVQPVTAGPASGTFALYTQWEWAEVEVY